jgi:hypothetical protein
MLSAVRPQFTKKQQTTFSMKKLIQIEANVGRAGGGAPVFAGAALERDPEVAAADRRRVGDRHDVVAGELIAGEVVVALDAERGDNADRLRVADQLVGLRERVDQIVLEVVAKDGVVEERLLRRHDAGRDAVVRAPDGVGQRRADADDAGLRGPLVARARLVGAAGAVDGGGALDRRVGRKDGGEAAHRLERERGAVGGGRDEKVEAVGVLRRVPDGHGGVERVGALEHLAEAEWEGEALEGDERVVEIHLADGDAGEVDAGERAHAKREADGGVGNGAVDLIERDQFVLVDAGVGIVVEIARRVELAVRGARAPDGVGVARVEDRLLEHAHNVVDHGLEPGGQAALEVLLEHADDVDRIGGHVGERVEALGDERRRRDAGGRGEAIHAGQLGQVGGVGVLLEQLVPAEVDKRQQQRAVARRVGKERREKRLERERRLVVQQRGVVVPDLAATAAQTQRQRRVLVCVSRRVGRQHRLEQRRVARRAQRREAARNRHFKRHKWNIATVNKRNKKKSKKKKDAHR